MTESLENPFECEVMPLENITSTVSQVDVGNTQSQQLIHSVPTNNADVGIRKRSIGFLKKQWQKISPPPSTMDELDREWRMKRRWKAFKNVILIVSLLIFAYTVYIFDVRLSLAKIANRQRGVDDDDATQRPTISSWYDSMSAAQLDLIVMPRYANESDYVKHANMCRSDVSFIQRVSLAQQQNNDWNDPKKPSLDSQHTYYYFDDRDRTRSQTYVSLNVIRNVFDRVMKSSSSIRDSDLLCTYMFGGWPRELIDIPCLCVLLDDVLEEKIARNIINPVLIFHSEESIEIIEEDLLFKHNDSNDVVTSSSNDISNKIPNLIGVRFETFVSSVAADGVSSKTRQVFDLVSNSERSFIPVVPQRREMVLAIPRQVNIFVWIKRLTKMFELSAGAGTSGR